MFYDSVPNRHSLEVAGGSGCIHHTCKISYKTKGEGGEGGGGGGQSSSAICYFLNRFMHACRYGGLAS